MCLFINKYRFLPPAARLPFLPTTLDQRSHKSEAQQTTRQHISMSPVPNESLYQVSGNLGKASCASVALNGVDYFFYYRSGDNELACLKSNDESKETDIGKTTFSSSTILNGSSDVITQVNAISPLAATDWSYGTSGETGVSSRSRLLHAPNPDAS